MHEKPRLDERVSLAEADGRVLSDDDRSDTRVVFYVVTVDLGDRGSLSSLRVFAVHLL